MKPHPIVAAAARGELPSWAEVSKGRRRHIERVGALLDEWADEAGLSESDRTRWKAAGWLHDSLKDGSGRALREIVEPSLRQLPTPMLHGPAAAELLRREGVEDQGLLLAVAYHTLGHPDLGRVGFALYAADYLEPGRRIRGRCYCNGHDPECHETQLRSGSQPSHLGQRALAKIALGELARSDSSSLM